MLSLKLTTSLILKIIVTFNFINQKTLKINHIMNLAELHTDQKEVSATNLFKGELGTCTAIQLQSEGILKEHITKTPALLLCISGMVTYKDEKENESKLESGDYVLIEPNVKHWLTAKADSQLVLLK